MPDRSNVSPEAEALARVFSDPDQGEIDLTPLWREYFEERAQRAIDAGWTPPPDPHKEIARAIFAECFPHWPLDGSAGDPLCTTSGEGILAAVRRMDLRRRVPVTPPEEDGSDG